MKDAGLVDGQQITCEDFLQSYKVEVFLYHCTDLPEGAEYQIVGDIKAAIEAEKEKKKAEEEKAKEEDNDIEMIQAPVVSSKEATAESKSETTKCENQEVEKKEDGNEKKRILDQNDNTKE